MDSWGPVVAEPTEVAALIEKFSKPQPIAPTELDEEEEERKRTNRLEATARVVHRAPCYQPRPPRSRIVLSTNVVPYGATTATASTRGPSAAAASDVVTAKDASPASEKRDAVEVVGEASRRKVRFSSTVQIGRSAEVRGGLGGSGEDVPEEKVAEAEVGVQTRARTKAAAASKQALETLETPNTEAKLPNGNNAGSGSKVPIVFRKGAKANANTPKKNKKTRRPTRQ